MKVRRYVAPSMRSAMDMVRQAQGSDVMILSNRNVEGGVEVITAVGELDQAVLDTLAARQKQTALPAATPPPGVAREDEAARLWTNPETLRQMQRELGALKNLVEQQLSGFAWHDFEDRHPVRARLVRALTGLGLVPQIAREVVTEVPHEMDYEQGWQHSLEQLGARLQTLADPLRHGGRIALCGSTGVGKTTLASKLAARFALSHSPEQVALISADDQRLGAHHQLTTFGRLLGLHVETLRQFEQLPARLEALRSKALVIVDLPGYPPHDPQLHGLLTALHAHHTPLQCYLVAAATTDYSSLARITTALADFPLDACCLTKLDEAAALGPALSMLIEAQLPLAYISAGQQVPDDLECITRAEFVRRMLALSPPYSVPATSALIEPAFSHFPVQGAH